MRKFNYLDHQKSLIKQELVKNIVIDKQLKVNFVLTFEANFNRIKT